MSQPLSQKDYLKKYLSKNDGTKSKKKKKRPKTKGEGLKIVDDDEFKSVNVECSSELELDLLLGNEDAPQVAEFIDESKMVRTTANWITVSDGITKSSVDDRWGKRSYPEKDHDLSPPRKNEKYGKIRKDSSPLRDKNILKDKKSSISEKQKKYNTSDDLSPSRHSSNKNSEKDFYFSKSKLKNKKIDIEIKDRNSDKRKDYPIDKDLSPIRKSKSDADDDLSPPRKSSSKIFDNKSIKKERYDSDQDLSPPRKPKSNTEKSNDQYKYYKSTSSKSSKDADRRYSKKSNYEFKKSHSDRKRRDSSNSDQSPPRRNKHGRSPSPRRTNISNRDESPPRRNKYEERSTSEYSKSERHRRNASDSDQSPPRNSKFELTAKMTKTLDGKIAGLQDAKSLRIETDKIRKKEKDALLNMNDEISGRYAKTVSRKSRKKEESEDEETKNARLERERIYKEKYSRWGKGLKQVEEMENKKQQDLHEMNKPLARYANDEDLDKHLREQLHADDPMLEYIQRKKIEKNVKEGMKVRPEYQGSYPTNRFDIKPGYRWDGVDRSNGYEKLWFEKINARKANEEEAYKWSTEDM
uniref:BUD13 homolog n=1 Tax=Xenopsylla cheopis TaxID=163159 RepID=A0A6M2DNY4_XENCH